ncbi:MULTISPECIES: TrkH family potassium uptake protein [Bacillaceae]|uniref:ATP synthase n=2 Tax=Bacillus infantis TaxID=324767 RepID=U5L514_9BACI|nr:MULTISPECIES: TrkH family potassium uptake protein [Bacillus]AGX02353.1 ATP synthase [Bacillus infantis NRRL B-14911]EAR67539.1 cation transporter [Bacillus sp. NRRL B-14911]MCA1037222.1 TrkH family potassium uptake protein [Bacillus infantis]MCP1156565.1 TrkH family potassium uptake protein [Bacillus infantis]MDW2878757.1 TrkH family potassium uptake protein [Bacillus infantis]
MKTFIEKVLERLSSAQLIVLFYLFAVILSAVLLELPITLKEGVELSFIDAFFTSVSAISVTGLSTVNVSEILSVPGTFIFAFILQFGGIGIMTLGTFFWLLVGKKIGLRKRKLIMTDQNQYNLAGLVVLIRRILVIFITIELIGAIILGFHFLRYFPTWQEAFLQGFFASVSATTNAGFDITGQSLIPFADDYFVQLINIILLIVGAIGFPVLIEIREFIRHRGTIPYKFTLFTKVTTVTFFLLVVLGTAFICLFEYNHFFADKSWHESFFYALFQSVSTRNGGLATMNISDFSEPTLFFISILMFIGASPSSVGGGIRTTTFAIMVLSIYTYAKGNTHIKVFKKEIMQEDVIKSYIVFATAILICSLAVILLTFTDPKFTFLQIAFEVASAFGTTGLSMGITADLTDAGKIIIILLMFIGRIGILSFLFLIRGTPNKERYHYPKEKIIIG